jgi:hypothetical protein
MGLGCMTGGCEGGANVGAETRAPLMRCYLPPQQLR